jgi:hypothetical protein
MDDTTNACAPLYLQVIEEAVYDRDYAASATGYIAAAHGIIDEGTAQSATATTLVLRAATPISNNDGVIGCVLQATGSDQGYAQAAIITDYVTGTDTATVAAWPGATPSGTITYRVFGSAAGADITTQLDTIETKIDTIDDFLDTEVAAVLAAVDTEVAAILADTNELQTDLANGGRLDLLVDGIKAKTDSLTFTVANVVDSNIQRVNDVAVTGDGDGSPFDVA